MLDYVSIQKLHQLVMLISRPVGTEHVLAQINSDILFSVDRYWLVSWHFLDHPSCDQQTIELYLSAIVESYVRVVFLSIMAVTLLMIR